MILKKALTGRTPLLPQHLDENVMFLIADSDAHSAWIEVNTVTFRKMLGKDGLQEDTTVDCLTLS